MQAGVGNTAPHTKGSSLSLVPPMLLSTSRPLLLQEYIQEGVQWAHLDMAGPAWRDDCKPAGPTGFGCATLVEWVLARRLPAEARLGALASVPLSKCL